MKVRPVKKQKKEDASGKQKMKKGPKKGLYPRSILTKEVRVEFCDLVREGLTFDAACDYLGIAGTTFAEWRRKGEQWVLGNGEPKDYKPYGKFVVQMKKAFAQYRLDVTRSLHNEHNTHWVRPLAILSRRDRLNWADREPQGGVNEEAVPNEKYR